MQELNITILLDYLKQIHSDAETIRQSQDIDYIDVVIIMGNSELGWNAKKEKVIIPMRKTIRYHKDTIRLNMVMDELKVIKQGLSCSMCDDKCDANGVPDSLFN